MGVVLSPDGRGRKRERPRRPPGDVAAARAVFAWTVPVHPTSSAIACNVVDLHRAVLRCGEEIERQTSKGRSEAPTADWVEGNAAPIGEKTDKKRGPDWLET